MKKVLWLTAAVFLLICLAACDKTVDSDVGIWNAISYTHLGIEGDISEIFQHGASLDLRDNGVCIVNIDGDSAKGEWDITGGILRISAEEVDFLGVFDGRTLILTVQALGIDVNFEKQGGTPSETPEDSEDASATPPIYAHRLDSGPYEWWFGEWFGSMSVVEMSDDYESPIDLKWDCFANISYMINDTSLLDLFGFGTSIGNIVIRIETDSGLTGVGKAVAVSGNLAETEVMQGDWEIDPGMSPYENTITWSWRENYEDGEYVVYQILMRPWGMTWDDIPEDNRPVSYDWYLEVLDTPLSDIGIHIHE